MTAFGQRRLLAWETYRIIWKLAAVPAAFELTSVA